MTRNVVACEDGAAASKNSIFRSLFAEDSLPSWNKSAAEVQVRGALAVDVGVL
jgi:hypothetical protein